MNRRQKEVQQAFLDDEKAVLKKLEKNYQDALDEINSKIELLMARQDADMQHVIYQVEYQKALKTQVQSILETLQTNEFETVSEYLANAYHDGFIGTMYDLQGQGIPLIFPIDQEAVVAAVQAETKLSEPLYTAMGKDITDLKKKITGEISRGLSSGQMYGEITRNIASWARIPKNNAMRIARTEAHRIQIKATSDAQHRAKEKGADIVKQWDASLDKKTRDSHRKVDGEIRELDEPFSNGLMYPGDPNGGAGEVINCRCALLQRARWALGNDYTKWSADAPIIADKDGTTQFATIDAKSFKEFKGVYMDANKQMTMNFENSTSSRVRSSTQKMKSQETIEKSGKSGRMEMDLQMFATIPKEKLVEYALNPEKSPKAEGFRKALGYTLDNWEELNDNIMSHIDESKFVEKGDSGYGMRYEQIIELVGANGKKANVLTAWIDDGEDKRLTTLYVTKKKVTE